MGTARDEITRLHLHAQALARIARDLAALDEPGLSRQLQPIAAQLIDAAQFRAEPHGPTAEGLAALTNHAARHPLRGRKEKQQPCPANATTSASHAELTKGAEHASSAAASTFHNPR